MIVVVPIGDSNNHDDYSTTCKCNPNVVIENNEIIIIHNSFDGREGIEWLNEVLNNNTQNNKYE